MPKHYTKQQIFIIRDKERKAQGKSLEELRNDDKKDKEKDIKKDKEKNKKKKQKEKPFINKDNKILLPNRESIVESIRQGNRTAILLNREFDV